MILKVTEEHFPYLYTQHGRVADAYKNEDFEEWRLAYSQSILGIYNNIRAALPAECGSILDIGGGMGGIDIMLARHYDGAAGIWILDGDTDSPEAISSDQPHNNFELATKFLAENETVAHFVKPDGLREFDRGCFDLVVSFAAYAFYIHPCQYLGELISVTHPGSTIILDVRRERETWLKYLCQHFGKPTVLETAKKYVRLSWVRQ